MASEICIKSGSQTICKSSPIRDCSCNRKDLRDPFYPDAEPAELTSPAMLLKELNRVLDEWERSQRREGDAEKLRVIWKIAQLVLLKEIDIRESFVITALNEPIRPSAAH